MSSTRASLGNMAFLVDPTQVEWDFKVRMSETETVGGRVVQIFGTDLGDMTVQGTVGFGNRAMGDTESWEALDRLQEKIEDMAEEAGQDRRSRPYRFSVPRMGWSFDVHIKSFSPVTHSNAPAHEFTLGLFIVQDVTGVVTQGISDRYLERLVDGVGWAQSTYNGPTEEEIEEILSPYQGSAGLMYKEQMIETFTAALGALPGGGGFSGLPGLIAGPEGVNAYLWALRMQESGGDYNAYNSLFGASGAYQYIPSTWNNYKGYSEARHAPPNVQDERAAIDAIRDFTKHQTWRAAASIHYSGQYWPLDSHVWDRPQPGGPTIRQYVDQVMARMAQAPVT